jgi:hypothetical protein
MGAPASASAGAPTHAMAQVEPDALAGLPWAERCAQRLEWDCVYSSTWPMAGGAQGARGPSMNFK